MASARTFTRRGFLGHATALGSAAFAAPYVVSRNVLGGSGKPGANERVQIGLIGVGARGKYLTANMPPEGRVVALCDCYLPRTEDARHPTGIFAEPLAAFAETDAKTCRIYQNYRQLLDDTSLDAVMIATPDHHHVLAAVLACQAGLDVYVEKPLSLTIAEGRVLVRAAHRYERVVQVGSQQRTMAVNRQGCEFIRNGGLGKVGLVELRNLPGPMPTYHFPEEPVPAGLDWDLFCGPVPMRPHHQRLWVKDDFRVGKLLWRGWDLYRDYSGHLMTNWGGHSIDMVQLALGTDATGPVEIWPEPGRIGPTIDDEWLTHSPPLGTVTDSARDRMRFCPVSMKYAGGSVLTFSPDVKEQVFHGEKGTLFMSRNEYRTEPAELAPEPVDEAEVRRWDGPGHVARPHIANWLQCIKTRTAPNAPLESGHRTATICHLANIARELGRALTWDPQAEQFVNDNEANALLERPRRPGWELPNV